MIEQRVALVTGGSRGIGRAISLALAEEHFAVMVNYNENLDAANETKGQIEANGGTAEVCLGNIAAKSHRDLLVEHTMGTFGRIDLLVNNAGIAHPAPGDLLESKDEVYDQVMDTNLKGPFFLTCNVARAMIGLLERKEITSAAIINISSIRSFTVGESNGEYCLSKAGLSMMTKLFAVRLARHGIGVYEVCPGIIDTEMIASTRDAYAKALAAGAAPIQRLGKPEEVARAVVSIARGDLPYATGTSIPIDGGFHIQTL
jgi:NAD(P)-dependent dehydrogenase (short-subunit alcohol dehydrogenase family)